jgi:hypothetical protein
MVFHEWKNRVIDYDFSLLKPFPSIALYEGVERDEANSAAVAMGFVWDMTPRVRQTYTHTLAL